MVDFDEKYWSEVIKRPDWYVDFVPYARKIQESLGEESKETDKFRKSIRHFFERALQENGVVLSDHGPNLDEQREPIDAIVIHHTSAEPGYRLSYMNAVQLLTVYAPYFMDPTVREERDLKGTAIWSGHFKDNQQVFYLYHWLVRMDGTFERLLYDSQIGWHSGNWDINKRSVAICLDNDYEKLDPTDEILRKLAVFIRKQYPQVERDKIIGHREVRTGTICPGTNFLTVWKPKLLKYLQD